MYSLEKINLGGVEQWISLRGDNDRLPILLSLHGGPGAAALPMLHHHCAELERAYLVVSWDQRGAGKSLSFSDPVSSLTIEQMLADTRELIGVLLGRFKQDKLFLLGHSWGSALGVWTAQRHPELIHAYVGVGQVSDRNRSEQLSLRFTKDRAKATSNWVASVILHLVGPPPWPVWKLLVQRYWLLKLGGAAFECDNYDREMRAFANAEEYSWLDRLKIPIGLYRSLAALWGEFSTGNLSREVPELDVPVYLLEGRHDHQVSALCAKQYFDGLRAPKKRWVWFERSAHSPMVEEPARFVDVMVNEVLSETLSPAG